MLHILMLILHSTGVCGIYNTRHWAVPLELREDKGLRVINFVTPWVITYNLRKTIVQFIVQIYHSTNFFDVWLLVKYCIVGYF